MFSVLASLSLGGGKHLGQDLKERPLGLNQDLALWMTSLVGPFAAIFDCLRPETVSDTRAGIHCWGMRLPVPTTTVPKAQFGCRHPVRNP